MAGPLSGIGGQQQLPINNALQPAQNSDNQQVRPEEESQPEENTVQAQGTAPAETQNTETGNENVTASQQESVSNASNEDIEQPRGSLVDIEV